MITTLFIGIIALGIVLWSLSTRERQRISCPIRISLSDLWSWRGTIDRGTYAFVGLALFAIKHNIDRIIATAVFGRRFTIFNYWIPPTDAVRLDTLSTNDVRFLTTMVLMSLPFIWSGVALTLRRLRSADLPPGLVVLFFAPFLNLVFFALLCLIPNRNREDVSRKAEPEPAGLSSVIPSDTIGSAATGAILAGLAGTLAAFVGVESLGVYGWGVFVALPFCMGLGSVLIHTHHRPQRLASCLLVSVLSVLIVGLLLFALAIEGIICILMAVPVATPLAMLGGLFGFLLQRRRSVVPQGTMMLMLALVPITLTGLEKVRTVEPPPSVAETTIRIKAPAEAVWRNLIAFSDIPRSGSLPFRLGVAEPLRADIDGSGVGALRQCLFSTGMFVERVTGWEENRYFAFSVVSAETMREFSPYDIHPRHLDGYFVPQSAEFHLIPNSDGTTTLRGTSRYKNEMWPGIYWRLWSDMIIHRVHVRVFEHIRKLSERAHVKQGY